MSMSIPSKSRTFRVAIARPCALAVPAMRASPTSTARPASRACARSSAAHRAPGLVQGKQPVAKGGEDIPLARRATLPGADPGELSQGRIPSRTRRRTTAIGHLRRREIGLPANQDCLWSIQKRRWCPGENPSTLVFLGKGNRPIGTPVTGDFPVQAPRHVLKQPSTQVPVARLLLLPNRRGHNNEGLARTDALRPFTLGQAKHLGQLSPWPRQQSKRGGFRKRPGLISQVGSSSLD